MRRMLSYEYIKKILVIAVPLMLSSLISQLQMLIDRIFIGRLSLESMSAVGNATTPMWTTLNVMYSLTTGATILVSQAYGAGDNAKGRSVLASLFKFNNVAGLFLFLFWTFCPQAAFSLMGVDESIIGMSIDYAKFFAPVFLFEGIGVSITCLLSVCQKTQIMIWYGLSRSLANVILDYAMIFGHFGFPAMGVKGAALATTIAELLGHIIIFIYALRSKELKLRPGLSEILSSGIGPYIGTIKLGAPAAGEEFAWNIGNLYLIIMLNRISVEAAGIHSIIFGVELIAVVVVESIAVATLTLSGFETGSGNVKGVWSVVLNSAILSWGISLINLLIFLLFPTQILGLFTTDEAVIASAGLYLLIVGIDLFPKSGNMTFGAGIKGYGEPGWMLKTQLFGTAFVIICSTVLVMVLHMGILSIFCLVVADETVRFIINSRKLYMINKEKTAPDTAGKT